VIALHGNTIVDDLIEILRADHAAVTWPCALEASPKKGFK
jgi:hypothetical protein